MVTFLEFLHFKGSKLQNFGPEGGAVIYACRGEKISVPPPPTSGEKNVGAPCSEAKKKSLVPIPNRQIRWIN